MNDLCRCFFILRWSRGSFPFSVSSQEYLGNLTGWPKTPDRGACDIELDDDEDDREFGGTRAGSRSSRLRMRGRSPSGGWGDSSASQHDLDENGVSPLSSYLSVYLPRRAESKTAGDEEILVSSFNKGMQWVGEHVYVHDHMFAPTLINRTHAILPSSSFHTYMYQLYTATTWAESVGWNADVHVELI